jgi:hypothetical protein
MTWRVRRKIGAAIGIGNQTDFDTDPDFIGLRRYFRGRLSWGMTRPVTHEDLRWFLPLFGLKRVSTGRLHQAFSYLRSRLCELRNGMHRCLIITAND